MDKFSLSAANDDINFMDYVNSNEFHIHDKDNDINFDKPHNIANRENPRKTGIAYRRFASVKHKRKLMKIIDYQRFYSHMGYVDWDWVDGVLQKTGQYIKYPKNNNRQKFLKRYSNKVVRKYTNNLRGNQYRKCFDYWWTLY